MSVATRFPAVPAGTALVPEHRPHTQSARVTLPPLPGRPGWYPLRQVRDAQLIDGGKAVLYRLDCGHYARRTPVLSHLHTTAYCSQCDLGGYIDATA